MNHNDQEFLVQKIRTQYTEKEHTQLDALKTLAMNVMEPGTYFGITIGANMMLPGILIGLIGIAMVCVNYPIYKGILTSRKKKYAAQIIAMSNSIMEG